MTDLVRLYENVSTPGRVRFEERTEEAGLEMYNQRPTGTRPSRNWASSVPIDYNNDGWVDVACVNRFDTGSTLFPYVYLLMNKGDGMFEEVAHEIHGIGEGAGGRDINYGDLDGDGKLDVIVSDGTVGGYDGTNTTLVYKNRSPDTNNWIELDIRVSEGATWAIGARVTAYRAGSRAIVGTDEVRSDFCYRSKRHPVVHFGLGDIDTIDLELRARDGRRFAESGLTSNRVHLIALDQLTSVADVDAVCRTHYESSRPVLTRMGRTVRMHGLRAGESLWVVDIRGRTVLREPCVSDDGTIQIQRCPNGLYGLRASGGTRKLVVHP
jgi:hypothetical protein